MLFPLLYPSLGKGWCRLKVFVDGQLIYATCIGNVSAGYGGSGFSLSHA